MNEPTQTTVRLADYDPDAIEKLLAAGWIVRDGNDLKMTSTGRAALRRGFVGGVPGERQLPIESVRARARPSIKKKSHR